MAPIDIRMGEQLVAAIKPVMPVIKPGSWLMTKNPNSPPLIVAKMIEEIMTMALVCFRPWAKLLIDVIMPMIGVNGRSSNAKAADNHKAQPIGKMPMYPRLAKNTPSTKVNNGRVGYQNRLYFSVGYCCRIVGLVIFVN